GASQGRAGHARPARPWLAPRARPGFCSAAHSFRTLLEQTLRWGPMVFVYIDNAEYSIRCRRVADDKAEIMDEPVAVLIEQHELVPEVGRVRAKAAGRGAT